MTDQKVFQNACNCGGYAFLMNGRLEPQPHMPWCRQHDEYAEWFAEQTWNPITDFDTLTNQGLVKGD